MGNIFSNLPVLHTDRLTLRPMLLEDIQDIFIYASNPEVCKYVPWETHESLADTQSFVDSVLADYASGKVNCWVIVLKETGRVVGTAGFVNWSQADRRAEAGYTLTQELWGQGLMTEAMAEIINFGFEVLTLNRLEARCQVENIGSARVLEKSGLKLEGTLRAYLYQKGAYRYMKIYSILRSEWEAVKCRD